MVDTTRTDALDWFESELRREGLYLLPPEAPFETMVSDFFRHQFRLYPHLGGYVVVMVSTATGVLEEYAVAEDHHGAKQQVATWVVEYWHEMTARESEEGWIVEAIDPPEVQRAEEYATLWNDLEERRRLAVVQRSA